MLPSIIISLALFTSLSIAAAPPRREPLHIPVLRRRHVARGQEADLVHYASVSAGLKDKYNFSPLSRRAQTTDVGITNQGSDTSYFAQVSVGTPPQAFNLVLDTGSSDLWFATTACSSCPIGTPELDPSKSSTFQTGSDRVVMRYGSGSAAGTISRDIVTMGPFTVDQQIFVAVSNVTSGLIDGELAGIMGLAFKGIASSGATPFWETIIKPGGVLTFGGTNSSLYQGNIDFQSFTPNVVGGSFWLQTVSSVIVNGNSVNIGASNLAAIDTGTTLIGGPTTAVNAIWSAIPGTVALSGNMAGFFAFPCNTQLTISISFGGPSWPISLADLNLGTVSSSLCLGAIFDITQGTPIQPSDGNPSWIVGDTFLKNVYSVFRANPPAVGFAQLSDAAGGSSGTPGPVTASAKVTGTSLPIPSAEKKTACADNGFGDVDSLRLPNGATRRCRHQCCKRACATYNGIHAHGLSFRGYTLVYIHYCMENRNFVCDFCYPIHPLHFIHSFHLSLHPHFIYPSIYLSILSGPWRPWPILLALKKVGGERGDEAR
ncbi:aspartic peptidase domain-containing protein [Multifurca ochricompacta]|uniref:Aspartic peptidase domain-containing protein n=1 Tax=Multifurca ochricompacta TaxID=376703 RepID=A0AAD4M3Y3_9AGAM|nr:aspartic peptidase domain-containing protein [Multifurca ochricompacta]